MLVPVAVFFLVVGLESTWDTSIAIVLDSQRPFGTHLGPFGVLLQISGYLVVPVTIGAIASAFFERAVRKRYYSDPGQEANRLVQDGLPGSDASAGQPTERTEPDA